MILKKAQSEVITTVLIILLVLAAIIIVWQVVQSTVNKGGSEIESQSGCMGIGLNIASITAGTTGNITVTRTAGADDVKVSNITILVDSMVVNTPGTDPSLTVFQTKTYTGLNIPSSKTVQVGAVLSGGTKCSPTASKVA